ncbi:Transglutaminase-like superfamily protein [Enhygromyxa salina]|uniref:Transglutaminase-like superfamily protein n=1 Tax=Enhygromyxa salina TaxID=215803 RepID=A0A2S9XXV2_9BACT|nr:transglutaminase-like domain-containing protein [Enhygromyxa salina]PRP97698.1 Transglutaminase-like superfamily protein [Enhygromyxa salina]
MPERRRRSWTSFLPVLVLAIALVGACSTARVTVHTEPRTLDAEALAERVRLGHLGAFGERSEGQARAREAARLAAKLGNADEAAAFAREQLDLARGRLLIVRIEGDSEATYAAALDELDEAARFAVEIGDELLDGQLVVEAAQFMATPKRARKAIARALKLTQEADLSWGYAKLWDAFEGNPSMLVALQRLRWRSYRGPGLPAGSPRLAPESLAAAGPEAVDLLWTEANRAATERRDADYERWLGAVLRADRWDPDALAARVVLDALARAEISEDEALLPDLATNGAAPLGSQARMLLRHRETPSSRALALFRAKQMVAGGTFGDAGELLAELELDDATDAEKDLRDTLTAMVALESGTEAGRADFQRWRRKARAQRSTSISNWVSNFEQEQAPAEHVALARAADRKLVTQAQGRTAPRLALPVLGSAAIDADSPKRVRDRALAAVAGREPELGNKLAVCRERKLFDEDCRHVLDELAKLDVASEEYSAGLDALGGSANVRASWFSPIPWLEGEQLPAVRERLSVYAGTRVAATTDFQAAALFSELAANRPDLARARLEQNGQILRPETRTIASMALRDLEDGLVEPRELSNLLLEVPSADVDATWFLERRLPGDPAMVGELFPGRSRLALFARGLALARMGAWDAATAELLLAVEELDGVAKGMVAGRLALAAQLADHTILRDRALAIADAEDPRGFMAPYVRARVAEAAHDHATAHPLYLEALARRPRALPAFEGALRTLELRKREVGRVRDALLLFPDSAVHWHASELLDAAAREEIDGPLLTKLWLAREDGAALLGIGEPATKVRPLAELGLQRLLEQLEAAPMPADSFPIAAKVLAWLGAAPPELRVEYRDVELWLTYLIGRDSELVALASATPRYQGFRQPPAGSHATLLLAGARKRHAIDDLLSWTIVREELWNADDPVTRSVISDLYAPIEDPDLAQYACLRMFQRDEFEIAAERCVPLWNELGGTRFLAVDLAYLALNDPERARANGLDLGEFFATAATIDGLREDPVWLLNASLWLSKQDEDERGAKLRVDQLALDAIATEPDDIELGQGRYRGALLRQQIISQFAPADRRRFAYAAGSAVRSLDLEAADLYAQRLLAWLPSAEDDEAPEFTARSPQMLAATRQEGDTSDAELRSTAHYGLSITALIRADLEAGRITRAAMLELLDAYAEDRGLAAYERVATDHPECHVVKLMLLSEYGDARMREQALALARELVELHPDNPLVLADALPLLTGPDDLDAARQLLAAARLEFPAHPWLSDEALPAVLTGAEDQLPAWLRTPEAFDVQIATIDDADLDALAPTRHADIQTSAEAFFAAAAERNPDGLGIHEPIPGLAPDPEDPEAETHSRVQFVVREPRASRCEGLGCAEPLIAEWTARNYALLWTRELELPAGPAIEFLVADGESVIHNVLIPTGGNLFMLISGSTPDDLGAFLAQIVLLRESFRPLDWSQSAAAAESMRSSGRPLPDDRARFEARRLLSRMTASEVDSCVLDKDRDLAALAPEPRAELLLDLFLVTREPWQRRALLTCTAPEQPEAARLALLTLLDPDAAVHAFGRAATQIHHERVMTDTRRVLYQEREPAISDPALTTSGAQPAFGLLQVIAALPDEHSRALTRELLGLRDPRLRALALAASATMDYFDGQASPGMPRTEVERLREVVIDGASKDAVLAVRSLMDIPGAANLAAIRERTDKLIEAGIEDDNARGLAIDLAWALARELDAKDRKRLAKLVEAVKLDPDDDRPKRAKRTREGLESMAEDHAAGRKLLTRREPATNAERATIWVREHRPRPAPRSVEQLGATPLAELTPGHEWTYVRVGNAGLFATSLEGLLRRLAPANAADAYLVRTLIYDMLLQGSFSLLSEAGGLDLSEPIECVSPKGSESFACSATVRDRNAVLSTLAARELGDDAGVAVPLSLATEFAGLPLTLGSLPVALHSLIEAPEDELEPDGSPQITAERLRLVRTIAGHELEYYATIELHENRVIVDSEHYMFIGDRLLVFSGSDLAEQLLREPPSGAKALAADPRFAAAVTGWRDGVALQAVDFTEEFGLPQLALEVVLDNEGIEFSARASGERTKIGEFGGLRRLLPDQHVAAVAVALEPDTLREYFEDAELERCAGHGNGAPPPAPAPDQGLRGPEGPSEAKVSGRNPESGDDKQTCGLSADDKLPPVELAEAARAVLLGWYPEVGSALWQDWVLVMPLDANLRKAMKAMKVSTPAAGELREHAGLFWVVSDGALIVASTQALAEDAQDSPIKRAGFDDPAAFAASSLDGQRAAAVVREMAERYTGDRRGDYLRLIATMVGLVDRVELRGEWTPADPNSDEGVLSASVALNLAESDEELALIDRWLASPEVGNASKLPRRLGQAETDSGLSYRIRVDEAEQFARTAVPDDNARISVELVGPDELRMTVLPSRAVASATTQVLTADERDRMLASDNMIRAKDQKIRDVANALRVSGDDAATVAAIVTWVHNQVHYEITPTSLDAVTILERGEGDCTEYALLTVTLLRAAGIPARLQEGMAASGEEMVAHAWVAWHDGTRWREVDPTAGTASVGSGHLELEVVDVLAMISLGKFEILAIDPVGR